MMNQGKPLSRVSLRCLSGLSQFYRMPFATVVLAFLGPPCLQEYDWLTGSSHPGIQALETSLVVKKINNPNAYGF